MIEQVVSRFGFKDRLSYILFLIIVIQFTAFLYLQFKLKSKIQKTLPTVTISTSTFLTTYHSHRYFQQRGDYVVLSNYVEGTEAFGYKESITLATISTSNYLDNIGTMVEFWKGPISVAVYAPGLEFQDALNKITILRRCTEESVAVAVKRRVSFHIFFDLKHLPDTQVSSQGLYYLRLPKLKCANLLANQNVSYRSKQKLMFPINMARNIARENSKTHYVLVSDIELYPNPVDLIPRFLKLIKRREESGANDFYLEKREVFVLPPFELSAKVSLDKIPRTKTVLQKLLQKKRPLAIPFHFYACFLCHRIPKMWAWINQVPSSQLPSPNEENELNIFHSGPYWASGSISAWEPFYIGTILDPPFDERLFRETALNKAIQASILCHSNYTFHILDKAFLVHKPGLKYGKTYKSNHLKLKARRLSEHVILPLQIALYGKNNDRCWQPSLNIQNFSSDSFPLYRKYQT